MERAADGMDIPHQIKQKPAAGLWCAPLRGRRSCCSLAPHTLHNSGPMSCVPCARVGGGGGGGGVR